MAAVQGGQRVAAADAAARAAGVAPGQPLADARALAPGLRTLAADPAADTRLVGALADWCGRYTPWTAVDATADEGDIDPTAPHPFRHGLWLDISGCAHLFGGEAALLADLTGRLARMGFANTAALADTAGAAWAVARFGRDPDRRIVPPGGQRAILAPLPLAALRLPAGTVAALSRVGLRRVDDLLGLPRAPLAARFGTAVARRLDQALGHDAESFVPRRPVPDLRARLAFAEPVSAAGDLAAAAERLLDALCADLERARLGARRLELVGYRVDGGRTGVAVGTSRPLRDPVRLFRLLAGKLERLDPGFGIETLVLAAPATAPQGAEQADMDGRAARGDRLADLLDRLGNRLGPGSLRRLRAGGSHLPERAWRQVPAVAAPDAPPAPPAAALDPPVAAAADAVPPQPRPLHLLPWPEPIEVVAPVPDHPPVLFRWRRVQHRIAAAEGPERIGPEWWHAELPAADVPDPAAAVQAPLRDYYRVEDEGGARYWLYREGLYRPGVAPRWFLHGFFG
ncbi:MAG: DNA polymerase Y family protein [Hyphomicrobiales bacterium]|nr:DNA polymerase Y family protein [Hyphomicrobiales bacterium]